MRGDLQPRIPLAQARDLIAEETQMAPDMAEAFLLDWIRMGRIGIWLQQDEHWIPVPDSEKPALMIDCQLGLAGPEKDSQVVYLTLGGAFGEPPEQSAPSEFPPSEIETEIRRQIAWAPAKLASTDLIERIDECTPKRSRRDKGGRPPKHDWTSAQRQLGAYIYFDGLPDRPGPLVAFLREWFTEHAENVPDEHQLRTEAQKTLEAYRCGGK